MFEPDGFLAPFHGKRCSVKNVGYCGEAFRPDVFDSAKNEYFVKSYIDLVIGSWKFAEEQFEKEPGALVMFAANTLGEGVEVDAVLFYDRHTGQTYKYEEADYSDTGFRLDKLGLKIKGKSPKGAIWQEPKSTKSAETTLDSTPLSVAIYKYGYSEAIELLRSGKDWSRVVKQREDVTQFTLLHSLAHGQPFKKPTPERVRAMSEVAGLLLDQGAEIDAKAGVGGAANGETPLMVALQDSQFDFAGFLLERGADPLAIDEKGISVLHWACGRPGTGPAPSKVVAELLRRGADPLLKAGKSNSPYWITKGDTPSKLAEASGDRARKKLLAAAVAARAGSRSTSR